MARLTPKQRCVQALVQLMGDDLTRARQRAARMTPAQMNAPFGNYPSFHAYVRMCEGYEADIKAAIEWVNSKED